MNLKNLIRTLLALVVITVVVSTTALAQPFSTVFVDATNGSNAYTGQNITNNPAGTGPKATLAAALPIVAQGGSVVIMAGTYNEPLDLTTGLPGGATPTTNYTLVLRTLNANTDVVFTGNVGGVHAVVNNANVTVTINRFGADEKLVTNPGVAPVINLTAGTINLSNTAAWTMAAANTVTYNIVAGRLSNAAPTVTGIGATTGIILNYAATANYTAGPEGSYASYGGIGQININNAGFTISFGSAIAFNAANALDVINVTNGGATFNSTVNLGVGDIVNAGGGAVAITGLVSAGMTAGAGVADADLSSIRNTGAGSVSANGGITWTGGDFAGAKAYGGLFAIDVTAGSITTGGISLVASNATTVGGANDYSFTFNNAGSLTVGFVTAAVSGDQNFAGSLTLLNAGTANIAGGLYRGALTSTAGTVTVTGNTIVNGVLTNAGALALGTNTLTLAGSVAHLTNGGTITATSGGVVVTATGANSFNGGTLSNVTINGAGAATTLGTNAINVTDLTVTQGTAAVTVNVSASGTVSVNGGTLTIANAVTLSALNFGESSGTVTLGGGASGVLDIKGNFSRTGGTFGAANGSLLSITGTTNQVVDGGPLFQVVNITFTNSVGSITVNNTIRVSGNAIISTATTVNFGTVNLVLNSATATIVNNGIYSTTAGSGGGLILGGGNLVTNGFLGGGQTMEGTGTFSYITVDVGAGNIAQVVNTLTGVKFNGILRLYTGVLQVTTVGVDFSPFGTSAKIVKHLWGAGAQPALTVTGGSFNNALVPYDLEYALGSDLAALVVSVLPGTIEYPAAPGNVVRNLTVSATASGVGGVLLNGPRNFVGNLTVGAGARLILGAALTGTAASGVHVIDGAITQNTPALGEKLVLTGGGTVTGGSGLAQLDAVDFNTTGTYTVSGMKLLGANAATNSVAILGGAIVNLSVADVGVGTPHVVDWGNVTNLNVANGRVNLKGDIDVANLDLTVAATGTLDFENNNIWWKSAGSFNGVAASTYLATGATTGGFLQIRANSGINTGGALVPRIIMDPAAAGTFTLTLGGGTGVSQILTNAGDDIIALGANTLTLGGTTTWNHGGTATYTGTGLFNVTGAVNANLGANATIPNLTVNNGANTFALVDNIDGAGVPTLNVNTLFTMTAGTINFNAVDISLNGAGAVFAYAAGTINQNTVTGIAATDAQNGELKFNNAGAQTFAVGTTVLNLPNMTLVGTGGVTLSTANPFTITKRLVFGTGALTFGADGRMTLADGAWVERNGALTLSHVPTFAGVVDEHYTGAGVIAVDKEMPAATVTPQPLRDLFINTNAGVDVNSTKNILVGRTLHLNSGNYDFENVAATIFTITMANGGTVLVTNGNLINGASATVTSLLGGPVTLTYNNTIFRATTAREYPATAGFVTTLNVISPTGGLQLSAARSCGDFVLNTGVDGPPATTNVQFDLNGLTLTVTNTSSATLTRGVLISNVVAKGVLTSAGIVTSTANVTVTNVNVNAATATLAGVFNGGGTATITGNATFAAFTGNAVVGGNTTLNGVFNGTLTAAGNITGAVNPAFAAGTNLVLNGTADQNVTVAGNEAFNNLTLNNTKTGSSAKLNWITTPAAATTVTLAGTLNLIDGLLVLEDADALVLPTAVIPFVRNVAVGRQSHVVGNVTIPLGAPVRYEYPVGSLTNYRKAVVEFPGGILTPSPLTIKYIDAPAGGTQGFPITNFPGLSIDSTAGFSWLVKSMISMGISQTFNLELYAEGWNMFTDVNDAQNKLRAIRRLDTGVQNPWQAQTGTYSNFVTSVPAPFPVMRVTATTGGIVAEGSHFTFGLEKAEVNYAVTGTVKYANSGATPLAGVDVTLNPGGLTAVTNAAGSFSFANIPNGTYTVTASSDSAWEGANGTDALDVLLNTVGSFAMNDLQLAAADVNASNTITSLDALQILQRVAGNISTFAKGDWVFDTKTVTVNNGNATVNLQALAVGDVNASNDPSLAKVAPINFVQEGKISVAPGKAIQIPVKVGANVNLGAMTLTLTYPADLVTYEGISSQAKDLVVNAKDGKIKLSWASLSAIDVKANEALFTLNFKQTKEFKNSSVVNVEVVSGEVADAKGNVVNAAFKIASVEGYVPSEFSLKQNYPNPFNPQTTIAYDLPVDGMVNLTIFNALGEQVATIVNEMQTAGAYTQNWNASTMTSGIYLYRIDVKAGDKSFTKVQKMILMK